MPRVADENLERLLPRGIFAECRHDEVTLVVFGAPYSPSIATISTAGVALVLNTLPPSAEPRLMFAPLRTVTRTMPAQGRAPRAPDPR